MLAFYCWWGQEHGRTIPLTDIGLFQKGMRFQADALCRLSRFLDHNPLGDTYLADAGFLDFLRPRL